jgi:hypothetical protein
MAFTRSLLTRLCEGLIRDFLANTDVQGYWKTRFYKGPFLGNDPSINSPQGTVLPAPGTQVIEPGVSGVQSDHILSVLVGIFEPVRKGPLAIGVTVLDEYDRLQLLKTIIITGSNNGESPGKIIDPDNAGSGDTTQKYLNTNLPTFRDLPPRWISKFNKETNKDELVASFWSFQADFETRIDNTTILRK